MMERKRKLPPRAAARVDGAKKRSFTPPERSLTPVPSPAPAHVSITDEQQLPRSIQAGHPLPTVEKSQAEELSNRDFQSIQESGVLAESLNRSRTKWTTEGVFEKYWTKPIKRRGVVKEEPNNPPKESMVKIGNVTITIEPHVIEATMYAVKDLRPANPITNSTFRPIVQYGPPNGALPPPTPMSSTRGTISQVSPASIQEALAQPASQGYTRPPTPSHSQPHNREQVHLLQGETQPGDGGGGISNGPPMASTRGRESVSAAPATPRPQTASVAAASQLQQPMHNTANPVAVTQLAPNQANTPLQSGYPDSKPPGAPSPQLASTVAGIPDVPGTIRPPIGAPAPAPSSKPSTVSAPGADPIIVTLAERASGDAHLRDLMKRVAVGDASPVELTHFQRIIDEITAEFKKRGGPGPSADRLIVDARTVKWFADEVHTILDIVLASNPNEKAATLRAPPGCDPLVVLLVRKALGEKRTKELVRRVAEGKTHFGDATDLKAVLDQLRELLPENLNNTQPPAAASAQDAVPNGVPVRKMSVSQQSSASTQALRSKGPPPVPKPDISAVVLEFSGGTGDRYLFPKYSILEYVPGTAQVLASFLLVRRGSNTEYGGDRALDYYQPITIRLQAQSARLLESLAKVVAPQDEVRRYMDDVMNTMTRAEYITLAMRLPKQEKNDHGVDLAEVPQSDHAYQLHSQPQSSVLWTAKPMSKAAPQPHGRVLGPDEQYQGFITSVT